MANDSSGEWIEALCQIVRDAGDAILAIRHGNDLGVQRKADDSPVTAADLAAQQVILDGLQELTDEPVVSEEAAAADWSRRRTWRRFWLVDPLDGTREFVGGRDEFTVNIARIEDGVPVLGVVRAPALDRSWVGASERGAWRIDGDLAAGGTSRPLRASGTDEEQPVVVASRSHRSAPLEVFLSRLSAHRQVAVGSSLKFCILAEGEADLYPRCSRIMAWDTAAGDAVLRAAGVQVTTWTGEPLSYGGESLRNRRFVATSAREVPWRDAADAVRSLQDSGAAEPVFTEGP
ncbi:MAG: 3'(2'),5'-bisphosphate nucleotidase CysQ [Acidobacteriota bacterium]